MLIYDLPSVRVVVFPSVFVLTLDDSEQSTTNKSKNISITMKIL